MSRAYVTVPGLMGVLMGRRLSSRQLRNLQKLKEVLGSREVVDRDGRLIACETAGLLNMVDPRHVDALGSTAGDCAVFGLATYLRGETSSSFEKLT